MSAAELDAQIRALATARAAEPTPFPAEPPMDGAQVHQLDNLLWHVRAAADAPLLELCFFHPGLGWSTLRLSRGQAEDLHTACEFAAQDLMVRHNPSTAITGTDTP